MDQDLCSYLAGENWSAHFDSMQNSYFSEYKVYILELPDSTGSKYIDTVTEVNTFGVDLVNFGAKLESFHVSKKHPYKIIRL